MKKILILIALVLLFLNSCILVYDTVSCMGITNSTNDTILVCYAKYNNIDRVEYCIGFDMLPIEFDDMKKIISNDNILILPDSIGKYCERGFRNNLFCYNEDNKGYFFIIKLETVKNYTWDEICKNKLYETIVVTREMLKENDWKIEIHSR